LSIQAHSVYCLGRLSAFVDKTVYKPYIKMFWMTFVIHVLYLMFCELTA